MTEPARIAPWKGRAMPRREDPALLCGQGRFVADLVPEGALWVEFLRSPVAAGAIVLLDVADAADRPDVVAVYTGADLAHLPGNAVNPLIHGAPMRPFQVLARGRVAAVGQPVAAIVARSRMAARDAAEAVLLEIAEEAPPPAAPQEIAHWQGGDLVPEGRRVSARLAHARVAPMPLEPRACLAEPAGAGLLVHAATQTPHRMRDDLAAILSLDPALVRVVAPDVGGAFGGKASITPEETLVAHAARDLGCAVAWVATRSEEFLAATQGRGAVTTGTLTLTAAGDLAGLVADLEFPLGHWTPYSAYAPIRNAGRILPGPYALGAVSVMGRVAADAAPAVNIYRGAGRPEAAMLMERLMDKAAAALGVDPLALRRRNLRSGTAGPGITGTWVDQGDYAGLLDRLETVSGYAALRAEQALRRAAGEVVGIGLSLYIEPCGQGWETAAVTLTMAGRFAVQTGSSAQGQGRQTAWAQIAADALGVDAALVDVGSGDTGALAQGIGALASRSTAIGGTALCLAGEQLRAQLCAALSARLGRPAAAEAQGISAGARLYPWAEVATLLPRGMCHATHRHEAEAEAWASGAALVQVAIDRDTGRAVVERIVWVDDAGAVINPLLVAGQLWGGLAQGLGCVLSEAIRHDADGQLLTGSLMDYAVPRARDMPLSVTLDKRPVPSAANPLGVKGVGEAGCIAIPPALLNALQDAVRPFTDADLPLPATSLVLWQAIHCPDTLFPEESP